MNEDTQRTLISATAIASVLIALILTIGISVHFNNVAQNAIEAEAMKQGFVREYVSGTVGQWIYRKPQHTPDPE